MLSEASTIVTGETREAFMNHRMGLSEPEVKAEKAEVGEAEEAEEIKEEAEQVEQHEEKKPNSKIEKRFSDLTKQREEAKAEAALERKEKEALQVRIKSYEDKPKAAVDSTVEPSEADYTDAFKYAKDLSLWASNQALATRDKQDQDRINEQARAVVLDTWNKRLDAIKIETPDYESILAESDLDADLRVSDMVRDAIIESTAGPKILLHLAQNPDFTKKLGTLSAAAALVAIGRLEAKYDVETEVKEAAKPVTRISKSAEPINPIRGGRSLEVELSADGEFTGSFSSYKQARQAGKLK